METVKLGYIVIYTPYITKNGRRIYASSYGKKAFRLEIPIDKYRRQLIKSFSKSLAYHILLQKICYRWVGN